MTPEDQESDIESVASRRSGLSPADDIRVSDTEDGRAVEEGLRCLDDVDLAAVFLEIRGLVTRSVAGRLQGPQRQCVWHCRRQHRRSRMMTRCDRQGPGSCCWVPKRRLSFFVAGHWTKLLQHGTVPQRQWHLLESVEAKAMMRI